MNKDCHLIYESWKEVFSGKPAPDRWKELTDMQRDLISAYIDKLRSDYRPSHMAQDIRLNKVTNSPVNPDKLKFVHIYIPEGKPEHVVELDTEHDEIYEPHAHPHGGREQVKLKTGTEDEQQTMMEQVPTGGFDGNDNLQNMGMGKNAEDSAEDKMRDRENKRDEKQRDAEVSSAFHYNPMEGLEKAANQIRDILQGAANDEARTEHIVKMAQTILGSPKDYAPHEYRKMLDGLIVLLNRFIVVPMN